MRQHITWSHTNSLPYCLNLSQGFKPISPNGVVGNTLELDFKRFDFAGGERHFQILGDPSSFAENAQLIITTRASSVVDIYDILLANDAARNMGFKKIHLVIPCFPAARQDRICNQGEPFTLKMNAELINSCGFESVTIYSPHSDVTPALIKNVLVADKDAQFVRQIIQETSNGHQYNIVCPDAGAGKRVLSVTKQLAESDKWRNFNMVRCEKVRNVTDGHIKEIVVHSDDLQGEPCCVVDDIVVYGGTFLGIAEKLREANCGTLSIFTSHADCQAGLDKLATVFDKVYTTNTKGDWQETDKIKVFKFEL